MEKCENRPLRLARWVIKILELRIAQHLTDFRYLSRAVYITTETLNYIKLLNLPKLPIFLIFIKKKMRNSLVRKVRVTLRSPLKWSMVNFMTSYSRFLCNHCIATMMWNHWNRKKLQSLVRTHRLWVIAILQETRSF